MTKARQALRDELENMEACDVRSRIKSYLKSVDGEARDAKRIAFAIWEVGYGGRDDERLLGKVRRALDKLQEDSRVELYGFRGRGKTKTYRWITDEVIAERKVKKERDAKARKFVLQLQTLGIGADNNRDKVFMDVRELEALLEAFGVNLPNVDEAFAAAEEQRRVYRAKLFRKS